MKKYFLLFLAFTILSPARAQKNDYVWVFGYYYGPGYPVPGLDFYWGSPDTVGFYPPFNFIAGACMSMSDAAGNLLFCSNGDQLSNWNNNIIQNSTGFNSGTGNFYNDYWQGMLSVPFPDHPDQYVIFHNYGEYTHGGTALNPLAVYYSVVDMAANGGEGLMTQKKISAMADTLLPCTMQAAKHANGRDWWVVIHQANSNVFRELLFTPGGVQQVSAFATGPVLTLFTYSEGQSVFSPDGSMYAIAYNTANSVYLYDFDRCTGAVTFRDSSHVVPNDPYEWPVWGCSFSPNSRYLYATTNNDLYQFDTHAPSMDSGKKLVGTFDGFSDPVSNYFFRHCPGPDGKIYLTSWGGTRFLHVINSPDLGDTLCDFGQHQLRLVSYHSATLPEFPNYRLGAMNGSSCDSLYTALPSARPEDFYLHVMSEGKNTIRINYAVEKSNQIMLVIYDLGGRRILQKQVIGGRQEIQVETGDLSEGLYFAVLTGNENLTSEFFIRH